MCRLTAVFIVVRENIATVWATSPHFTCPLGQLAGFSNAKIHRKNKMTAIPEAIVQMDMVRARTDGLTNW